MVDKIGIEEIVEQYVRSYLSYHAGRKIPSKLYDKVIFDAERAVIKVALEKNNLNQLKTASMLGINRNTLHAKMKKLKIKGMK